MGAWHTHNFADKLMVDEMVAKLAEDVSHLLHERCVVEVGIFDLS